MADRYEKILAVFLRIVGIITMTAIFPAFFPFSWIYSIHAILNIGDLSDIPIIGYLARSLSLFYVFQGAVVFFVSFDLKRYRLLVRFIGIAVIVFGFFMIIIDIYSKMPLLWTTCEGPFVMVIGFIIACLSGKISPKEYNKKP